MITWDRRPPSPLASSWSRLSMMPMTQRLVVVVVLRVRIRGIGSSRADWAYNFISHCNYSTPPLLIPELFLKDINYPKDKIKLDHARGPLVLFNSEIHENPALNRDPSKCQPASISGQSLDPSKAPVGQVLCSSHP